MSASVGGFHSTGIRQLQAGVERLMSEKFDARIARFERLGLQLFSTANCFVSFGQLSGRSGGNDKSITEMEALFCDAIPGTDEIVVIPDLNHHVEFAQNRYVAGPPFIRFFASHPVYTQDGQLAGCLRLVDYQPRQLDESQRLLLTDLAALIERELALGVMLQTHNELLKQNRVLKREAMIDPLLGTWNKGAIIRSLSIEMERCTKAQKPLSLLFVYPDQIDQIRAAYGLAATDQLLIRVVSRVRSCIRPFDALGRFGSDQLLIVLPGASHLVAFAVAERIRLAVMTHPEWMDDAEKNLTVCSGVVSTDTFPEADPEALISLAEKALLSARTAGNNSVVQAAPAQPDMII